MTGAIDRISNKLARDGAAQAPEVRSFKDFLLNHARVKTTGGNYVGYSFEGREALEFVVDWFDHFLGSETGKPLPDASIDVCGGAQFGKTILALNFGAYLTGCRFLNWGYYLPDDDLVEGIVDAKLRPDVIEQIEWLTPLMAAGKFEDQRGKSVNRKGAFRMSDGERKAFGMVRGMGKIPTSFSMDCAMEDEKDDIPPKRSKYLTGRMTSSDLRLRSSIGTQRVHGAGQHKQWELGSQGVIVFEVPGTERRISPEDHWPDVCRMAVDGDPAPTDPKLTLTGNFEDAEGGKWDYDPAARFYLADPETGAVIDRSRPIQHHHRPDRIKLRRVSIRLSQLSFAAMPLGQMVSRWQEAVRDPDMMVVFHCDVLANPKNAAQALTPQIIHRARTVEHPFDLSLTVRAGCRSFAGLDTGNQCWFLAREVETEVCKRIRWAEQISLGDVVRRAVRRCRQLDVGLLLIDARPAVTEAREITYALHGLQNIRWPRVDKPEAATIVLPGGLTWHGDRRQWTGLRAAVVEFVRKSGGGIEQKLGQDSRDGQTWFFPIIQVNRFETIDRVVKEFLTPEEGVTRMDPATQCLVVDPVMRMPQRVAGSPAILETLEAHIIRGSQREESDDGEQGDYLDKCENHLLLADAYSGLAEEIGLGNRATPFAYEPVSAMRPRWAGGDGLAHRRRRTGTAII